MSEENSGDAKVKAVREIRSELNGYGLKEAVDFYNKNPRDWRDRLAVLVDKAKEPTKEDLIREVINGYYLALDMREHGGVAMSRAFNQIEKILDMHWVQGEQKAKQQSV